MILVNSRPNSVVVNDRADCDGCCAVYFAQKPRNFSLAFDVRNAAGAAVTTGAVDVLAALARGGDVPDGDDGGRCDVSCSGDSATIPYWVVLVTVLKDRKSVV